MKTSHSIIERVQSFFSLIRPFTLIAPLIVSISIMIASFFYQQHNQPFFTVFFSTILPASLSLAILNGASNALNQATDYQTDSLSKPYRPIPRGVFSVKKGKLIALGLYIIAISLAFLVHLNFLILIFSITAFTVTYSLFPRMKDKLFFNQLWIAIPRGFLGILASWCVFASIFQPVPLLIA
ncbi:MAG: UbiA prenyltransferase family protein, partial [Candidatus Thermoplasmatota archaeon]|nr:UbiA prenyltransferase family protein [Candidatus Thermoplasmatota archaeon]